MELCRKVPKKYFPPLDPGIAPVVIILQENGIETYQSCQGGPGHSALAPTIWFHGNRGTGFRAYEILVTHGLDQPLECLQRVWTIQDGELTGPTWQAVFRSNVLRHVLKRRTMTRAELKKHTEMTLSVV